MVRIISQLILTALLCTTTTVVQAHIFMIEKWSNGSQDLYCLSDYHRSLEPQNKICNQQQIDIVDAAKKHNAFVITEDTMYHNRNNLIANPLQFDPNENYIHKIDKTVFKCENIKNDRAPITGLTAHCHCAEIPIDNVEFRNVKNISLLYGYIDSATALTYSGKVREQILAYNDGPTLNDYYKKKIDEYMATIEPCINFFDQLCNQNCSLKEALALVPYDKKLESVELLHIQLSRMNDQDRKKYIVDYYDTTLLDLRIIHSIFTHLKAYTTIFVCAGGGHIERIKPALELMGFVQTNCLERTANEQDGEPTALDIHDYFSTQLQTNDTQSLSLISAIINVFIHLFWW